jgi:exosome complex component RRP45
MSFALEAIKSGFRPSLRGFSSYRAVKVLSIDDDLVLVGSGESQNSTVVSVSILSELVSPSPDKPNQGRVFFNVVNGSSEEMSQIELSALTVIIDKIVMKSNMISTESLCVLAGKLCWSIRIDVTITESTGGNIIDVCMHGIILALATYRIGDIK